MKVPRSLKQLLFTTSQWPLSWFVGFGLMVIVVVVSWGELGSFSPKGRILVAVGFCLLGASSFGSDPSMRWNPAGRLERIVRKASLIASGVALFAGFWLFDDRAYFAKPEKVSPSSSHPHLDPP